VSKLGQKGNVVLYGKDVRPSNHSLSLSAGNPLRMLLQVDQPAS
jgi:hypothetical protein